jgi:hypothetical protein
VKSGEPNADEKPKAEWRFRNRFPIQDRMVEIITLTIEATDKELARLRRKLERTRLGS